MDDAEHAVEAGDVADVTNSTAHLSIEALLDAGTIHEDRARMLQARYKELHDRVLQIYANDNFLLKRARQCKKDLEGEKAKVEKCGEVALQDDSTISNLKKELAAFEQELSIAQERESMLQVEALELDRKRQTLTHDVDESIAQEERKLKPLMQQHQSDIVAIKNAMEDAGAQHDVLKMERERLLAEEAQVKADIERDNATMYQRKMEFARIEREPERARKQADIVVRAAATAEKENNKQRDNIAALGKISQQATERKNQLNQLIDDQYKSLETKRAEMASVSKLNETVTIDLEVARRQAQQYSKHMQDLEEMLKATSIAMNNERENLAKTQRDKEHGMKQFKKLEQSKADTLNESEMFRKQLEILHREEVRLEQQRGKSEQDLEELKREVDILITAFLREEIAEKRCATDKIEMHQLIKNMEDEVTMRSAEEQQLRREASALSIRREQMSRDCSRNQGKVQLAHSELKVKEVVLLEFNKRLADLVTRLNAVVDEWHRRKRERSAKAQLIQTNSQTMSETQEKIKILENELEVLHRESLIKDQDLKKKEREQHEHEQQSKNLLVEKNRWSKKLEAAGLKENDLKRQMSKLNNVITSTEDEMLRLKEDYEDAVENRNYTGIQLIDRNDELCILYEKANIQESILKRGMMQLNQRDEDIRKLAIELADLQRDIDLCQKILPQVRDMEEDLAETMIQLDEERWKAEVLEHDLTDPENATRWRKIGKVGVDTKKLTASAAASAKAGEASANATITAIAETPASSDLVDLSAKQQQLEERLAKVNEKLMEKELILEEITELSNRLRRQALNGRDFTLALAKKVNGYQFGIKGKTKKMMATLSELSMVQASSIQLEKDVMTMEQRVAAARSRMDQGEAPSDDVALQLEKDLANAERRRELHEQRKQRTQQELSNPPGTVQTTAEQRPNAYMQGDNELLLPQPYGAHGLFMPSKKHNVHRFFRKPNQAPLDFDEDED